MTRSPRNSPILAAGYFVLFRGVDSRLFATRSLTTSLAKEPTDAFRSPSYAVCDLPSQTNLSVSLAKRLVFSEVRQLRLFPVTTLGGFLNPALVEDIIKYFVISCLWNEFFEVFLTSLPDNHDCIDAEAVKSRFQLFTESLVGWGNHVKTGNCPNALLGELLDDAIFDVAPQAEIIITHQHANVLEPGGPVVLIGPAA